jgi:hypothetical protein
MNIFSRSAQRPHGMDAGRRSGFKESSTILPDKYWSAPSNRPNEGSSFSFGDHEGVSIRQKVPRHILEKFPAVRPYAHRILKF